MNRIPEVLKKELLVRAALMGRLKARIFSGCYCQDGSRHTGGDIPVISENPDPVIVFPCEQSMSTYLSRWGWVEL